MASYEPAGNGSAGNEPDGGPARPTPSTGATALGEAPSRTVASPATWDGHYDEHPVNELLSNKPGAQSPFGDDITFPLPVEKLFYHHPGPENRPNLAGS